MKVLVIADMHLPFEHNKYLRFLKAQYKRWECDTVVCIGDLVDNHAISYHEKDPDGLGAKDEEDLAIEKAHRLYDAFPNVYHCLGNHDRLPKRKTKTAGLSSRACRSFKELYEAPSGWSVSGSHILDGVEYSHGEQSTSQSGWQNHCKDSGISTVTGHAHSIGGVRYHSTPKGFMFSMRVGCGIDKDTYAMAYAKHNKNKPVIGCGVVIDGKEAYFIPMDISNPNFNKRCK